MNYEWTNKKGKCNWFLHPTKENREKESQRLSGLDF